MTTSLIAMGTFALITSISPGPVNILATVTGANHGYVRTIPHITGATLGFVSILFLFGFGLPAFTTQVPYLAEVMTYIGGSFLLYLAYKIATQQPTTETKPNQAHSAAPSCLQGMMCQWLNPKAWMVSLAGISLFYTDPSLKVDTLLLFCGVFFIVCYTSISAWAVLGTTISIVLETPDQFKLFNISMGLLLGMTVLSTFAITT